MEEKDIFKWRLNLRVKKNNFCYRKCILIRTRKWLLCLSTKKSMRMNEKFDIEHIVLFLFFFWRRSANPFPETGPNGSGRPEQSIARLQYVVFLSRINMAANAMETDDLSHLPSNNLRRSNSAPNVSAAVMSEAIPIFQPLQSSRQRRFSTSQMALNVVRVWIKICRTNANYYCIFTLDSMWLILNFLQTLSS